MQNMHLLHVNISSVIMVTGGQSNSFLTSVDLLRPDGCFLCSLPRLPQQRHAHSQVKLDTNLREV